MTTTLETAAAPRALNLRALLATGDDRVSLGLRLLLAAVIWPHGAQHLAGWFGGHGFAGSRAFMAAVTGAPAPLATLAILVEFFAPLALVVGIGGRIAAGSIAAVLAVAATTHRADGFFMNWFGNQRGEGYEYHMLAVGIALALVVRGSGAYSVDRRLAR